jgi:hypothetical protein
MDDMSPTQTLLSRNRLPLLFPRERQKTGAPCPLPSGSHVCARPPPLCDALLQGLYCDAARQCGEMEHPDALDSEPLEAPPEGWSRARLTNPRAGIRYMRNMQVHADEKAGYLKQAGVISQRTRRAVTK